MLEKNTKFDNFFSYLKTYIVCVIGIVVLFFLFGGVNLIANSADLIIWALVISVFAIVASIISSFLVTQAEIDKNNREMIRVAIERQNKYKELIEEKNKEAVQVKKEQEEAIKKAILDKETAIEQVIKKKEDTIARVVSENRQITGQALEKKKLAVEEKNQAIKDENLWRQLLIEKSSGFPSLLQLIDEYESAKDEALSTLLLSKEHPAKRAADIVREESKRRRKAEYNSKQTQAIIEYYENIAPFLLDFKNEIIDTEDYEKYRDYDEEERLDPTTQYLTKEEYRNLPSIERNQMALDRFWNRPNKSKWLLGRMYERYIGFLFEEQGYIVDYFGIIQGYEDLGRDLICKKNNEVIIIQCKNWAEFKTIHEKHVFQLFGTVFQYKFDLLNRNASSEGLFGDAIIPQIRAIFYTTTQLSDMARCFAKELEIELKENFKFDRSYPCIKCNISRSDDTKIYHLPFDQQYDKVKIEKHLGEFYCATVKEAEEKGFRRAFRYSGIGQRET